MTPVPPSRTALAPPPPPRPSFSSSNLARFVCPMENRTMNSTMSSVIMSA
jgi:hypothetical protein